MRRDGSLYLPNWPVEQSQQRGRCAESEARDVSRPPYYRQLHSQHLECRSGLLDRLAFVGMVVASAIEFWHINIA